MTTRLDREMLRRAAQGDWALPGLGADGPADSLKKRLALFGQFVGDREILPSRSQWRKGNEPSASGEVHVRWILGGTGIQDVWGPLDGGLGRLVPQGSTLRFYDPSLRAWRSTWVSPNQREVRRFVGKREGDEVVLREQDAGWRGELWIFSEITSASFDWRAETRPTPRGKRRVFERYSIRRT